MTLYYSKSDNAFHDDGITAVPQDGVEISKEEHAYLLEGQSQGKIIAPGPKGRPVLKSRPAPKAIEVLEASKKSAHLLRASYERSGMAYTFPGNVEDVVQTRNDQDWSVLHTLATQALILKAEKVNKPILEFRGESNLVHNLTPDQMLAMTKAAFEYRTSLFKAQWAYKKTLEDFDPEKVKVSEIKAASEWSAETK